jgi:hypothetical protein
MKHDGARFEQNEAVFLKERYLPKGLQRMTVPRQGFATGVWGDMRSPA